MFTATEEEGEDLEALEEVSGVPPQP
jgi:hypothetical protein